jgi:hypothetical protein
MLPDFICVGAQKAGTTSLWRALKQHPDVHVPPSGEVHFFDTWRYDELGLKWYKERLNEGYSDQRVVGDISPGYMGGKHVAAKRIFETVGPDVKLIFMLRNPAERAYSAYIKEVAGGVERLPFEEAIKREHAGDRNTSYLRVGHYKSHLGRFGEYFPSDNIKIVLFDDFIKDQASEMGNILDFISVDSTIKLKSVHANKGGIPRLKIFSILSSSNSIVKKLREYVAGFPDVQNILRSIFKKDPPQVEQHVLFRLNREVFKDDIFYLERSTNRDLSHWLGAEDSMVV